MKMYNVGETVYIVSNNSFIKKATVINNKGALYTLRFEETGGGTKLRESRLFKTEKEANEFISNNKKRHTI